MKCQFPSYYTHYLIYGVMYNCLIQNIIWYNMIQRFPVSTRIVSTGMGRAIWCHVQISSRRLLTMFAWKHIWISELCLTMHIYIYIYVSKLTIIGSDNNNSAPSHYLNQWWHIVTWTHRNDLHWNHSRNSYFFIQENEFVYGVSKMVAILCWPQCAKGMACLLIDTRPMFMMTSSNGNIFRVSGPLCGEFTGPGEFPAQRPVTRSFDVFFDLRPNKRLSKQPWGWWFETPSPSLWRHRNVTVICDIGLDNNWIF